MEKGTQIAGLCRQHHVEAYIQLNIFHSAILNPMWRFYFITYFIKHQLHVHKANLISESINRV